MDRLCLQGTNPQCYAFPQNTLKLSKTHGQKKNEIWESNQMSCEVRSQQNITVLKSPVMVPFPVYIYNGTTDSLSTKRKLQCKLKPNLTQLRNPIKNGEFATPLSAIGSDFQVPLGLSLVANNAWCLNCLMYTCPPALPADYRCLVQK